VDVVIDVEDIFSFVTVLTMTFFPTPRGRFYPLTFFARTFLPKDVFSYTFEMRAVIGAGTVLFKQFPSFRVDL
jgi:hypothetical protein